eukprot:snap_masked-scaffold_3-processed-gene-19.19-mRNA-1 protein AED:1.00 eAED:1.00 QI:0/0/0/0/1/1/2/0/126
MSNIFSWFYVFLGYFGDPFLPKILSNQSNCEENFPVQCKQNTTRKLQLQALWAPEYTLSNTFNVSISLNSLKLHLFSFRIKYIAVMVNQEYYYLIVLSCHEDLDSTRKLHTGQWLYNKTFGILLRS